MWSILPVKVKTAFCNILLKAEAQFGDVKYKSEADTVQDVVKYGEVGETSMSTH